MPKDTNIAAQEKFAEGVNSGNFDVFDEVVSPDVVDHDPAPEQGPGPQGFKDMFQTMRTAFPDLEVTPEHMTATEDDVALAYTITGTHQGDFIGVAPTGRKITARGVQIGRFEDGRLAERWGSSDQLAILQQIGAEPQAGEQDKGLVDKVRDSLTGQ
ncbi:MAG: ester cyclase [Rubrobacter sp.]|nr:ester cyclase [Rubrobacter sp.]